MSRAAWKAKSADLPDLTPDLSLIARQQREIEALRRENERLRARMALMAAAVRKAASSGLREDKGDVA